MAIQGRLKPHGDSIKTISSFSCLWCEKTINKFTVWKDNLGEKKKDVEVFNIFFLWNFLPFLNQPEKKHMLSGDKEM